MKRFWAVLLCCMLLSSAALAETTVNGFTRLSSLDDFMGIWTFCAGNDVYAYLVLHEDSTYESYNWWQLDVETPDCDALYRRGTYAFNPADSSFTLEGDDMVYTARTAMADENTASGMGEIYGTPDMPTLLLEGPAEDLGDGMYFDPTTMFVPMKSEEMRLLPTAEALCADGGLWVESAVHAMPADGAPVWTFGADGAFTREQAGQETARATYAYDNGVLTLTQADGAARHLLLQYTYVPLDYDAASVRFADILDCFDFDDDALFGVYTLLTHEMMLARDLDAGGIVYLFRAK